MAKLKVKSKFVMNRNFNLSHFANFVQIKLYMYCDVKMSDIQENLSLAATQK